MSLDTRQPLPLDPFAKTGERKNPSTLVNRNVTVAGHRTSIRLEATMWDALQQICREREKTLNALVTEIAAARVESSLTAAIRVYLVSYFRALAAGRCQRPML